MKALIAELEHVKQEILKSEFSEQRSLQVDRLDSVIDWLKEQ